MKKKFMTYTFLVTCLALFSSCGKKDENKNVVTTDPQNKSNTQFPHNTITYKDCNQRQIHAFSRSRLCQDVQFHYNINTQNSNLNQSSYCDLGFRREIFNRYSCNNIYSWRPNYITQNIYNNQNRKFVCKIEDHLGQSSYATKIIYEDRTFMNHQDFVAIINKSSNTNHTSLSVSFFDHNRRHIGNTLLNFNHANYYRKQRKSLSNYGPQITCWPLNTQNQSYNSTSSSGSFFRINFFGNFYSW